MRTRITLVSILLLLLAGAGSLHAKKQKQQAYWVFDHVETVQPGVVPHNVTISGNHTSLSHEDTWFHEDEDTGELVRKHAVIKGDFTWTEPQKKVAAGKEDSFSVSCLYSLTPADLTEDDLRALNLYGNTVFPAGITRMNVTVYPPGGGYQFNWVYKGTSNGSTAFSSGPTAGQLETFLPDGSWVLVVSLKIGDGYSKGRPLFIEQNYYYRYEGPSYKEVNVDTDITVNGSTGEDPDNDTEIPWGILFLPPAAVGVYSLIKNRDKIGRFVRKGSNSGKESKKKKEKEKEEEKEPEQPRSTFVMKLWKDFGNTLVVGDAPVTIGARIEEITADGVHKERPDMTQAIWIRAEEHCDVTGQKFDGRYMTGKVTAKLNPDDSCPDDATILISYNGKYGRLLNHVRCLVEDTAMILVGPALNFAAGQGKTLFMEFALVGAASSPENIDVTLDDQGYNHFEARLEQDAEDPDLFRIHLTEFGDDKAVPGTIQPYDCRIEVTPRGGRELVTAGFVINRIHLGLRVQLQALKAFLVMPESSHNHDIIPKPGYTGQRKPAESRIDMMLMVVDEQDGDKIHPVRPDKDPEFIFEDVFENSMLFTEKTETAAEYIPTDADLGAYDDRFFRDPNGEAVPSPVDTVKFKYQFRGVTEDGIFWGIFYPSAGFLVAPNRSHARVKIKMTWHGQEFTEELVVPLNSQPYRDIRVPAGSDIHTEEAKWEKNSLWQQEQLTRLRWKIASSPAYAELRPLFYKVVVMLEGFDMKFGFDQGDFENIMQITKDFQDGKIGTYYAVRQTVAPEDDSLDLVVATIANMDRSIPVIICRVALGIVTGGVSELILTPISALTELKQYVDEGGDSVWGGIAQVSFKIIAWDVGLGAAFKLTGKVAKWGGKKIMNWWTKRGVEAANIANKTRKIGEATKTFLDNSKANKNLAKRPPFNSATTGSKIARAADVTKKTLKEASSMADEAIETVTRNSGKYGSGSKFMEECAKLAEKDGKKIVDEFTRVMNNPTATVEEVRRVTLALQGSKAAQDILRSSKSNLLRANFNAQMKQFYKEVDEIALKRLGNKMKSNGFHGEPKLRVYSASGNADDALRLGEKIAADRDVTYQFWDGKEWVDLPEPMMEDAYGEAFNLLQYKFIPTSREQMLKTLTKADQALVNGLHGLESYGQDLGRILDPSRAAEKLADPKRVSETFVHKCKEWLSRGKEVEKQAMQLMEGGLKDEAMHVMGYGETLIAEGIRQDVKQFKRILQARIETAALKGSPRNYKGLMAKIRVLERVGNPPPPGTTRITVEQARQVLQTQFGTTFERVVEECGEAVVAVNESL